MTANVPPSSSLAGLSAGRESCLAGRAILVLAPSVRGEVNGPNGTVRTIFADALVHLVELASRETRPVVLLQGGSIEEPDIEVASGLHLLPCRPSVAVLGLKDQLDAALTMARRLGLGCIFPHDCLSHPGELGCWVNWIDCKGAPWGLQSYLANGAAIARFSVRNKQEKAEVIESVIEAAAKANEDLAFQFDLRLILEELLNNAIYHAFQDSAGREKYRIGNFRGIADGEHIDAHVGSDGSTFGVAISDNQGNLRGDTVLNKLERHVSIQGLLDENGRGVYLTYSLAGRVIFNLRRNSLTELVVLFPINPNAWPQRSSLKPVLVFDHSV